MLLNDITTLSKELTITRAASDDFQDIISLLTQCNLVTEDISNNSIINFLIARNLNKQLVGIIALDQYSNVGLLRSLAVVKDYRNRGIAKILVKKIEEIAAEENLDSLYLLTESAANFFYKLGYRIISRDAAPSPITNSMQFLYLCPSSSTCMTKCILKKI